jgi:hypothetical protein
MEPDEVTEEELEDCGLGTVAELVRDAVPERVEHTSIAVEEVRDGFVTLAVDDEDVAGALGGQKEIRKLPCLLPDPPPIFGCP